MPDGYGNLCLMDRDEHIARITFNRQEKRNAMSAELTAEIRAALRASWDCTVVTISGGDGPAFCAGADLSAQERREENPKWTRTYEDFTETWEQTNYLMWQHPGVVIASVNGYCLAGGGSILASCDLAISSDRATYGITEMGFGLFPALVVPLLSKLMNKKHLAELMFTVERIDAQEAHRMGLVNWVVPHDELKDKTEQLAQRIATLDPVRVESAKRTLNMLEHMDWTTAARFGGTLGAAKPNITDASANRTRFLAGQGAGMGQGANAKTGIF
jgi:trans-feruloyl-CoA hydratase/vanillin synthase